MSNQLLPILDATRYCDIKLLECGKEQCIPSKQFHYTPKSYHLFHYVLSGKGIFEVNGKEKILSRGSLFYIPPQTIARYSPLENNPWQYIWLGFDGQMASYLLKSCRMNNSTSAVEDTNELLKPLFEQLFDRYASVGSLDIVCLGLTYQIFGTLIPSIRHNTPTLSAKEKYVNAAKEFIIHNYQFNIKIGDIANNVNVNPNYLSNIFKEMEGISPKKYLTQIRMQKAVALLTMGKCKIKDVGEAVGYVNQLHFSTEFKKTYGVSPQSYAQDNYEA